MAWYHPEGGGEEYYGSWRSFFASLRKIDEARIEVVSGKGR